MQVSLGDAPVIAVNIGFCLFLCFRHCDVLVLNLKFSHTIYPLFELQRLQSQRPSITKISFFHWITALTLILIRITAIYLWKSCWGRSDISLVVIEDHQLRGGPAQSILLEFLLWLLAHVVVIV